MSQSILILPTLRGRKLRLRDCCNLPKVIRVVKRCVPNPASLTTESGSVLGYLVLRTDFISSHAWGPVRRKEGARERLVVTSALLTSLDLCRWLVRVMGKRDFTMSRKSWLKQRSIHCSGLGCTANYYEYQK